MNTFIILTRVTNPRVRVPAGTGTRAIFDLLPVPVPASPIPVITRIRGFWHASTRVGRVFYTPLISEFMEEKLKKWPQKCIKNRRTNSITFNRKVYNFGKKITIFRALSARIITFYFQHRGILYKLFAMASTVAAVLLLSMLNIDFRFWFRKRNQNQLKCRPKL